MITSRNLDDTGYWRQKKSGNRIRGFGQCIPGFSGENQVNGNSMISEVDESRFLLWVDAVGGFLVCTRDELTLGQSIPESHVDIPVLGDLARKHLKLIRSNGGYLLQPFGYAKVNGQSISDLTILRNGDEIELTGGIRIGFSKSHPLSATARLDFLSPHRTQPWSDAILLMAESCVLGPNMRNHVVCRDWAEDLVIFRKKGQLFCKSFCSMEVDGELVDGKSRIRCDSRIEGNDFSMTLEPLSS